jgi:hypothetical protein
LVALFIGAAGFVSAQTIASTYTDYTNSYSTTLCDLTAQGTIDWLQCGVNNGAANVLMQHKAPGTSPAITVAITPTAPNATTGWFPTWWTDGAIVLPVASNPLLNNPTMNGQQNKWQSCSQIVYTATVDPAGGTRVLKIWTRNNAGTGSTMTAQLTSGAPVTLFTGAPTPFSNGGGAANFYGLVRIIYSSPTPSDILTVTYVGVGGSGLQAAGIALSNLTAPVFSPSPVSLRSAAVGTAYTASLATFVTSSAGGALTYTPTGAPAWLTLNPATGAITGTPVAAGPVSFTVQVTDAVSGLSGTATVNLNVLATANPAVTKIAIVRDANNWPLDAYKAFLENTVYPGRTMVYYDVNSRYTGSAFTAAQRNELLDSDLIVFSNDVNNGNYTGNLEWDTLQVPILSLSMGLSGSMGWVGGNGGNTYALRMGPQSYMDEAGNRGWQMMYNTAAPTAGVPRYYNNPVDGTDPFFAGIPPTIAPYVNPGGVNPGEGPQYGVSGCNLGTTKNGDQLVLGQWYTTGVWLQLFKSAMPISTSNGVGANGGRTLLCVMDSADVLYNNWYARAGYDTTVARWNQDAAMVSKNGFPMGARRFMYSIATGNFPDRLTGAFADPVNGMTATGLTLLKNAHLQMYNPVNPAQPANPLNRRATVNPGAPLTVLKLSAQPFIDVPLADVVVTDGGDGVAPTIGWTISPAAGYDAVNSTGLTTANPTLRFTLPGVYTATVKASKLNLDYVSGSKVITVQAPSVPFVVQTVPRKGRVVANLNFPANVTLAFDHLISFTAPLNLTVTVNGMPTVVPGTTLDNINFSFNCSAISLTGTNTPIFFSLDTSTVKDGFENILSFNGSTYQWFAVYNAAGPKPIVVCSNRGAADDTAYQSILKTVYGPDAPIVTLVNGGANGFDQATWSASTAATLTGASLVILDTDLAAPLNTASWAALAVPILCKDSNFLIQPLIGMAPAHQNSGSSNKGFIATNLLDDPYFENVYVRGDDLCPVYVADNGARYPRYDTPSVYTLPAAAMPLGMFSYDYMQFYPLIYWPKNTVFYSGTTISAPARRMFFDGYNNNTNAMVKGGLTANGTQMWTNVMKYFGQPTGAPQVVWSDPAATVVHATAAAGMTVSVRFDRSTTSPGNLTVTGSLSGAIGTYLAPVGSQDNVVWTYTVPVADLFGKLAQTFTLSADMSTVTETESGYGVPYVGSPYAWTTAYDPAKFRVIIGILDSDRTQNLMDSYTSLIKGVYGPNTWVHWLPNTGVAGYGNQPWQAPMLANVNALDMLIFGRNDGNGAQMTNARWPVSAGGGSAYPKPIMIGNTWNLNTGNFGTNIQGGDDNTCTQIRVSSPASPLFRGVTVTGGLATIYSAPVGAVSDVYGITNTTQPSLATLSTDVNRCEAYYIPANTLWYTNSTPVQAGARMIFGPAHIFGASFFTADGVTLFGNALKMLKTPAAPPTVVSKVLGAGTVTVTFDQKVTSPGALTMKDGTNTITLATVTTPASTDGGITWVYTLPAGIMVGQLAQSFNFSMVTTGLWEITSGLQLPPAISNPYTWLTAYDPATTTNIVVCTNKSVGIPSVYTTFLQSVYPGATVTYPSSALYKANPWSAATLALMQNATLVIMDGNENAADASYANPQWNNLTTPILSVGHAFLIGTGVLMQPSAPNGYEWHTNQYVTNLEPMLFNGVAINGDGTVTTDNLGGNMDVLEYPAANLANGINYTLHTQGETTRPMMQYWPAFTTFYNTGSFSAAGRRMCFILDKSYAGDTSLAAGNLTANGAVLTANVLRWMAAPVGPASVVSTIPGATVLNPITAVTVTFSRHVSRPGTLTIKDAANNVLATILGTSATPGVEGSAAGGAIRWSYPVPAGSFTGKLAQTFTFSMVTTGIIETESPLQLPFVGGNPYTWTSAYDPGQLGITILGLTQNGLGTAAQASFEGFVKTIWGPGTKVDWMNDNWCNAQAQTSIEANMVLLRASIAAHDLVVVDRLCDSWKFDNGHGWNPNAGLVPPTTGVINQITRPLISFTPWALQTLSASDGANDRANTTQFLAQQPASPVFNGVTIPGNNLITAFSAPVTAAAAYYNTSGFQASTTDADPKNSAIALFPAGSQIVSGGIVHPGPIGSFQLGGFGNIPSLTADGRTMLKNTLLGLRSLDAPPVILSVTPAPGALFTSSVPSVITVTFDRPVAGATNITVNGIVVGSPVGSVGNTVWSWTIPGPALPNVPTTVNVSLLKTGIYETLSAVQLPLGTGTYDWSFTFDKTQYQPKIAFVTSTDTTSENHAAYTSFVRNDVYSTTLFQRTVQIEDIPGKYYNMNAATKAALQVGTSLVVIMPFNSDAPLGNKATWNAVTVPILNHKVVMAAKNANGWGWGGNANNDARTRDWDWAVDYSMLLPANMNPLDPLIKDCLIAPTWDAGAFSGCLKWFVHASPLMGSVEPENMSGNTGTMGTTYTNGWGFATPLARWDVGCTYAAGGSAVARRIFMTLGPNDGSNGFGTTDVALFFNPVTGAHEQGAKQVLRNALRWLFNPDAMPFPLAVKSSSPPMNGAAGVLGPITVTFSKAVGSVSGVGNPLAGDLTWNASSSAVTYLATTATPSGTPPSDTWVFDGPWETNPALIGQYQPINITLNAMDTPSHSHIMSVDGDGCPLTLWTWNYVWAPVPAAVPTKTWTLYE